MFRWLMKLACIPVRQRSGAAASTSASTRVAPESSFPCFTPDLIFLILSDIWDAAQTTQERSAFVKNTTLVNRTWLALVAYITSRDVHIHTAEAGMAFARRLSKYPGRVADLFTMEKMRVTNAVCRSVTFHIDGTLSNTTSGAVVPAPVLYSSSPPPADRMCDAVEAFLHSLAARPDSHWQACLPHLRHIALLYTHWGYDDTFRHLERGPFPPQVTRLSIHHAFPDALFRDAMRERWLDTRQGAHTRYAPLPCLCRGAWCGCGLDVGRGRHWQDPSNVRHLDLSGATAPFAIAVLRVCTGVETLELGLELGEPDGVRLEAIAPLPPTVRTVVLHPGHASPSPGTVDGPGKQIWWRRLSRGLDTGLFPLQATCGTSSKGCDSSASTKGRRIVVRLDGAPDPVVFETVRGECRRFGVELVHELVQ